jgi:hypothetical protein
MAVHLKANKAAAQAADDNQTSALGSNISGPTVRKSIPTKEEASDADPR